MPAVSFSLGQVEMTTSAKTVVDSVPDLVAEAPGGLYPMQARAFQMDEWRLMNGWPVAIPAYDIRVTSLCSASGEVLRNRIDPTAVRTGALLRWVAAPGTWDTTALRWSPVQNTTGVQVEWRSSVRFAPTLITDYQYRVGNERFTQSAFNFDSDSRNHMWADLSATIGGSAAYTLMFVLSPNSAYGNNVAVPFNTIWGPGKPTPDDAPDEFVGTFTRGYYALTTQGRYLYVETETTLPARTVSIDPGLQGNAPLMIAVVFDRPETTVYVGNGPSSIRSTSIPSGTDLVPGEDQYVLGRSISSLTHCADMALMDLGVYADRLTSAEVADEFAKLSQGYGGDI